MKSNYQNLILNEFLTQKKPCASNRLLVSKTRNTSFLPIFKQISPTNNLTSGVFAPPPKISHSNIRKIKKQETEQPTKLFKDFQYKHLQEGEFHAVGERSRQNQIKIIIKLFHFYAPLNQMRRVTADDILFFKKHFKSDFQEPKMKKNQSISGAQNELKNSMKQKAYKTEWNMSLSGNQDDLYHLIYLKWMKNITCHNDETMSIIRKAIVVAIFAVSQWDTNRQRNLKKQVVEWNFELSD